MMVACAVLIVASAGTPARAGQVPLTDAGGKTLAKIYACESCAKGEDKPCTDGVGEGVDEGKPCGQCLLKANYGKGVGLPADVRIYGHLKDEKGQPLKGKFVRLFLPNNWSARSRSGDEGLFVVRLGATVPDKAAKPLALDLGDRVIPSDSKASTYNLFMLRPDHAPCAAKR